MGDVDKVQEAEEAAAQRAEEAAERKREKRTKKLQAEPFRLTARKPRTTIALPLACVHPGDNIRLDLPEIEELARSIREVGLLTPLIVRPWNTDADADGKLPKDAEEGADHFRLIAGHRRHAALTALWEAEVEGHDEIACEVREDLSEAEAYALMLTENVQRVPLEPIQAARALRLLLDLNEGLDAATLARSLGVKPAWAQTHLKLLDLPEEVQERIEAGDLSVTIADLLRRGEAAGRIDKVSMVDLANKVASGEITSTQVRKEAGPPPKPNTAAPKTVSLNGAGESLDAEPDAGTWANPIPAAGPSGEPVMRPPTPLTAPSPNKDAVAAAKAKPEQAAKAHHVPWEDRLDSYLLGRALREWADDDYLDNLGIDRVQTDAYALALGFEERIAAIRHISATLMEHEASLV